MLRGTKILNQNKFSLRKDCIVRSKHSNEGKHEYFCDITQKLESRDVISLKLQPFGQTSSRSSYHQPQMTTYPATKQLPLPLNIEDLASSEKLKFSPQRNRDITSSYISSTLTFTDNKTEPQLPVDERIELYDCSGTINLSSAMQSNVPFPFVSRGKPIHLNMPGGQWRQKEKYVSEELNKVHHTNTQELTKCGTSISLGNKSGAVNFYLFNPDGNGSHFNVLSTSTRFHFRHIYTTAWRMTDKNSDEGKSVPKKTHYVEKLKMAVKEYGPVIIVIHITISLMSLGVCYLLITSGIDLSSLFQNFGVSDGAGAAGTAAGFVVAYGVHKALAPARVALTLTVAPFIVRKLRNQAWWPLRLRKDVSSSKTLKAEPSPTVKGPEKTT